MVETVIVVPVLMVILLIVIQIALWAHAAQVVQLAASEGDRAARSQGGGAAAGVAQAQSVISRSGSDLVAPSIAAGVLPGDLASVTVTGHAVSIVPGFSLPVSAIEVGPVQEFRGSE